MPLNNMNHNLTQR